jgi:hypothetical protein
MLEPPMMPREDTNTCHLPVVQGKRHIYQDISHEWRANDGEKREPKQIEKMCI